jgi:hypothetical protein
MRSTTIASIGICCLLGSATTQASDVEDIIESTFREAVVKIDVSSNTPVIKDNVNICVGEGTGFLVTLNHVVTAEHVYALPPECGDRIILVKSKAHNIQKLASVIATKDDVALLKVDTEFPKEMCALALLAQDVYDTKAIRFGIPGGFTEPPGAIGIKIGKHDSDFSPLIVMMPTATEKGESGGPVIYQFNVVGLTRAKHDKYPAYSFMTVGSVIRSLMAANSVQPQGHICNPVESSMWTIFIPSLSPFNHATNTGQVIASIKIDKRLSPAKASVAPDFVENLNRKLAGSSVTVHSAGVDMAVQGRIRSADDEHTVYGKVEGTAAEVSIKLQQTLWDRYVAEGEKLGKWKDAVTDPIVPPTIYPVTPTKPPP